MKRLLIAMLCTVFIAACGGGGGSSSTPSWTGKVNSAGYPDVAGSYSFKTGAVSYTSSDGMSGTGAGVLLNITLSQVGDQITADAVIGNTTSSSINIISSEKLAGTVDKNGGVTLTNKVVATISGISGTNTINYTIIGNFTSTGWSGSYNYVVYNDYYKQSATYTTTFIGESTYAPTGVAATVSGSTTQLKWDAVSNATSYNIYWTGETTGTQTTSKIENISGVTYNHTDLTIGRTYQYRVSANFVTGEGPLSDIVSVQNTNYIRETEPNDSISTAMPIVIGGTAIRGQAWTYWDADYYKFTSVGDVVTFKIKADDAAIGSSPYFRATILASDGTTGMASLTIWDGTTGTLTANLTAGTYYLKIDYAYMGKDYIIAY